VQSNASKVDGIIAENPGKSLEELVSSKKINADQKAQVLKKPALQLQLAQYEEQIAQYRKFDEEHKTKASADLAQLERTLKETASKELEKALADATKDSQESASSQSKQSLLLVSQFLRLAAVRRGEEQDEESDENKALEGLLAAVYTGNAQAVSAMTSLIEGSSDVIRGVDGEETSITCRLNFLRSSSVKLIVFKLQKSRISPSKLPKSRSLSKRLSQSSQLRRKVHQALPQMSFRKAIQRLPMLV